MILPASIREHNEILTFLRTELPRHFKEMNLYVNVVDRLRLISDLEKWREEIPIISLQAKRKVPVHYDIYFDNEWVCGFYSVSKPAEILKNFWSGLRNLVLNNKVYLEEEIKQEVEYHQKMVKAEKVEKKRKARRKLMSSDLPEEVKEAYARLNK